MMVCIPRVIRAVWLFWDSVSDLEIEMGLIGCQLSRRFLYFYFLSTLLWSGGVVEVARTQERGISSRIIIRHTVRCSLGVGQYQGG